MNRCDKCVTDKSNCIKCRENPIYNDVPTNSLFMVYTPTCPKGYKDCIKDPAYIKHYYPDWYKDLYGSLTPEEASKKSCNSRDRFCYDDEDK